MIHTLDRICTNHMICQNNKNEFLVSFPKESKRVIKEINEEFYATIPFFTMWIMIMLQIMK